LSPLIFNIAMSALDEHLHAPWKPGGTITRYRYRASNIPSPWGPEPA
jgi:RNA-directed DNA polymerase